MRLENSAKNIKTAWVLQLVHVLCQFVSRTAIIYTLSIEYVGLSGLFSNILTMLSLAELGVGEAIVFSLYGPISRGETDTIKAIMKFYQKVYIGVGLFILAAGFAITPFIDDFIKDVPDIPKIYLIYMLYVVATAMSYFFSYRATFITANQRNYIVVLNNGICEVAMVIAQVAILLTTKNYILFMVIGIGFVIIQNISITIIANREYPYLKESVKYKMPSNVFTEIKKNTGAMVFHKIGTIVVFATDNLIISKFVGLVSVGMYANYVTVTNAVTTFISKFFNAISASIGNLAVEESIKTQEKTYFRIVFINFWLFNFSCCCLFNLLNPFIGEIWLSEKYVFDTFVVLLIVVKIYISGMRSATQTFKNAKGLYWYNKYMPIYESLINLALSLWLVQNYGVAGVLMGTIASSLLTCVWIEPNVLYKHGFKKKPTEYYKKYALYFLVFTVSMLVTYGLSNLIGSKGIVGFIEKCLICGITPNLIMWGLYRKTDEFKFMMYGIKKKLL